jgi:signal transduction histidine kinase
MRALAANNMSIEIEGESRRDEIGEMARAVAVFRSNAVELAHSQRGLIQQASMLAERLEAEQALTTLQRNFVSMASHEFRTPLTIIDGHAQRLISLQSRLAPEDIAARAGRIRKAVRQMTVLIEQLLNSSRILDGQTSGLYFHPTDIDLIALISEVCALYREISPDAQIVERVGEQPIYINGDPNLLFQLFGNILSNSIKYSPAGGCIKITYTRAAHHILVNIEDNGIGVPAQDVDKIFERYHRGVNVSGIVGTGVGLYIVKIVANLHGGDVAVTSQEGQGACFTVRLPL